MLKKGVMNMGMEKLELINLARILLKTSDIRCRKSKFFIK